MRALAEPDDAGRQKEEAVNWGNGSAPPAVSLPQGPRQGRLVGLKISYELRRIATAFGRGIGGDGFASTGDRPAVGGSGCGRKSSDEIPQALP